MYAVIEFGRSSGGGIAIVRKEWMTPRKKECFWPPFKQSSLFNRCLLSKGQPEENWTLHDIERIFYKTDDIGKAREKLRKAESDSEVLTELDEGGKKKRKRKPVKKLFISSSSEDEESPVKLKNLPKPPSTIDDVEENISHPVDQHNVSSDGLYRGHTEEVRGHCTSQDFTTSPLIETPARSQSTASAASEGLNVLASHLAKINRRLDDMEKNQNEILARLCPTTPAINILPPDVKLPCETLEEVNDLEDWLLCDTNKQSLSIASSLDDSKVQNEPQETQETRSVGTVGGKVYKSYIGATGNFLMVSYCLLLCILTQLFGSGGDYWITYWVNLEEQNTKTLREQNMPLGNFIKSNLTTNATSELTKSNNDTYVYAEDGELGGGDFLLGTTPWFDLV